jgi:hypothetical protein
MTVISINYGSTDTVVYSFFIGVCSVEESSVVRAAREEADGDVGYRTGIMRWPELQGLTLDRRVFAIRLHVEEY